VSFPLSFPADNRRVGQVSPFLSLGSRKRKSALLFRLSQKSGEDGLSPNMVSVFRLDFFPQMNTDFSSLLSSGGTLTRCCFFLPPPRRAWG